MEDGDPPVASGGRPKAFFRWSPEDERLRPLKFEYQVPDRPDYFAGEAPYHFPWEDVQACREDAALQREHDHREAHEKYSDVVSPCPLCDVLPRSLEWIYFRSPPETWRYLAGREGWLTICDDCGVQVDAFIEIMS